MLMLFSPLMVKMADMRSLTQTFPTVAAVQQMEITKDLPAMKCVIKILGCSNLLLFATAAWFNWRKPNSRGKDAIAASGPGLAEAR
jgi:hypothetical protein